MIKPSRIVFLLAACVYGCLPGVNEAARVQAKWALHGSMGEDACTAFDGSWHCAASKPDHAARSMIGAGARSAIIQASWTVSNWVFDFSNVSGNASDTNDCITTSTPCKTWQEIQARLGTFQPRWRQSVTITGMSAHTDSSDPIYLAPFIENGATVKLIGLLNANTQGQTGTLASTVVKNRATPQLLNVTLGAGGAVGQVIVATHSGVTSQATLNTNTSGNAWSLSQPLLLTSPPTIVSNIGVSVAEQDTWANGDTYTTYTTTPLNVVLLDPVMVDYTAANKNLMVVENLTVYDPDASVNGRAQVYVGDRGSVLFHDVSFQRGPSVSNGAGFHIPHAFVNCDFPNGESVTGPGGIWTGGTQILLYPSFLGGQTRGVRSSFGSSHVGEDIIFGVDTTTVGNGAYSCVYIASAIHWYPASGNFTDLFADSCSSQSVVWGPGILSIANRARFVYNGTGTTGDAVGTFLQTGGFQLDGKTTACNGAQDQAVTLTCNISLTAVNLDAATPLGFAANAWSPGGSCVTSYL